MTTGTFAYKVRDRDGKLRSGSLQAATETQVASKLKAMGYSPLSITPANTGLQREVKLPSIGKKVKLKELAVLSRQFATMINSGLSLLRALTILVEQTDNKKLQQALSEVRTDVETGSSLSGAMARQPDFFPPLMVNMTRAGEVGGFLDLVLMQIAANYEAEVKLRGKIKAAMTYPAVVFVMAIVAVIGMLIFIVPVFAGLFDGFDAELPAPTRFLVFLSGVAKWAVPLGLVGLVALAFTWPKIKNDLRVRNALDPIKLKAPVFGPLAQKVALSRFARNLGTMMQSGVPILQSLDIVADTTGNVVLERAIRDVQNSVRQGEALAKPLENHAVFPPMVVQMMAVGEDTGALDTMLHKISEFYDQEVEATAEALTALIEPLMIAFLGAVIGSMIVALYMPIFSLMNVIK
jgi:type IV pilus assembly protein PilC